MSLRLVLLTALLLICTTGCARTPWVELAGQRYQVEIADQEGERQRGLMFRDELAADHGMLFIHEDEQPLSYWMKNTHIPLDILYFDHDLKLVGQQRDVPPCSAGNACPSYPSKAPALYVLELNAGQAAKLGVKDGDTLKVDPKVELKAQPN
ncbi:MULTISPECIES: DUF192 domain-containing protein [Pseudoxanthomonas]|uniref:DUF192 domain-containing protein n=1 Tax=Pseudoxanthomonas winnipegensis TaxID=2480810 RepID=A0A4V2KKR2_9GAMM|nr:DUF192 domain-containing protein [Pseudoxanthomonas winnipegensis]TAA37063.1 DUF192 domain-containing protein [Pseudoxanthomonas winnipegensis]TBV75745.1 DUF192 domain-containing protein [Pseudoxanthomonas winnipegensis]